MATLRAAGVFCILAASAAAGWPATPDGGHEVHATNGTPCADVAAAVRDLASNLNRMRSELMELRIETQRQTIPVLEHELKQIREEQARRRNDERIYQTQIDELDQVLATHRGDLTNEGKWRL